MSRQVSLALDKVIDVVARINEVLAWPKHPKNLQNSPKVKFHVYGKCSMSYYPFDFVLPTLLWLKDDP